MEWQPLQLPGFTHHLNLDSPLKGINEENLLWVYYV
jgi:hypothetical protein